MAYLLHFTVLRQDQCTIMPIQYYIFHLVQRQDQCTVFSVLQLLYILVSTQTRPMLLQEMKLYNNVNTMTDVPNSVSNLLQSSSAAVGLVFISNSVVDHNGQNFLVADRMLSPLLSSSLIFKKSIFVSPAHKVCGDIQVSLQQSCVVRVIRIVRVTFFVRHISQRP